MTVSFDKKSITLEAAQKMVDAAIQKARQMGVSVAVAVVDSDGVLKAFGRMDGAILLSVLLAQQKAWSAISFNTPTHQLWEFIKDDPPLLVSLPHQGDMVPAGGGYPIIVEGQVIGGIGASGAHYTRDQRCAEAALAVVVSL
jgi:uncharacterized protein GlcG (DUF336 family)